MEQAGIQLIAQGAAAFDADMKSATAATNRFVDATEHGGGRVSKAGQVITGALREVGAIAVQALGQALRATADFVGDSIGLAGDFEAGMLEFQAVAGKEIDAKGLEQFKELFLDIGKRLPVSTREVQQATIELVKGGIDPATVAAGGLESSIKFAAAAMDGDLNGAAEISAKIVGGWASVTATAAEKAALLSHAQDMLTKTANAATVGVDDLSLGLFNVQGTAKAMGIGLDETMATLALLAPNFSNANTAGTSYRNFLVRLQPTTDNATAAMMGLGLITADGTNKFFDSQGAFIGTAQASELLHGALSGLTAEQKTSVTQTIFGNDAMNAAIALADNGAQGYEVMADKIDKANGVLENAAIKQGGFNTAMDNAKGSVEVLQLRLGEHLLPILTTLLNDTIAPGINAFTDWSAAILSADDPLKALLASIETIAPGFGSFLDTAKEVGAFIGDNLKPILAGLAAVVAVAVVPALLSATAAFIGVAAPIVAIGVAAALLYKAWESDFGGIRTIVTQVWNDTLLPAFKEMQAWLAEKIPPAIKTLSDFWTGTLQPALAEVWAFLTKNIFPVLSDLVTIYIAAAMIEVKALATLWTNVLQPALAAVWSFLSGSVIPIFKALFEVNWAIATKAVEAMAGLWQKVLQPAFQTVSDYITGTVVPALTDISDYLNKTFGPTLKDAKAWLDDVTGGFGGVSGAVKDVIGWISNLATSISTLKLPDWLTPGSPTPWETALLGIGAALSKSVAPGLAAMRQGMQDIGTEITDTFEGTDIIDTLTGLGENAMDGFGEGLKDGMRQVVHDIDKIADDIEDRFNEATKTESPSKIMIPVGMSIMQGIMEGMADGWPGLQAQIGQFAADLVRDMEDIGRDMRAAIADGFGATASIDRQIAKNLDAFKDVLPRYEQYTTGALKEAQSQAEGFLDPAEGAKFFAMRSKQILEYAKLQKELEDATTAANEATDAQTAEGATDAQQDAAIKARQEALADAERIRAQMLLINRAQTAEISQFDANKSAQQSPMQQMAEAINDVMKALNAMDLTEEQIKIVDLLSGVWAGMQAPSNARQQAYANPPMMSSQYAGGGSNTSNSTQNINMPIYTNNTPAALQQSWAIMEASMTT